MSNCAKLTEDLSHYINKKVSYCRRTARRAILVNSCYVSRATGVVSNSKHYLQGHSRALALVTFYKQHTISN